MKGLGMVTATNLNFMFTILHTYYLKSINYFYRKKNGQETANTEC